MNLVERDDWNAFSDCAHKPAIDPTSNGAEKRELTYSRGRTAPVRPE